jgi:hypothetical protein
MVSIIVAIISLIGSCIAIYSNFIKDLLTSKKVVYKERLDKFYIPFYQKYCAGFLSANKFSSLDFEARSIFLDLFTQNIHLMDAHSQSLYSKFYLAFLNLLEAEDENPDFNMDICCDELDNVFNELCTFTFNEYKRILKQCHLPVPLI